MKVELVGGMARREFLRVGALIAAAVALPAKLWAVVTKPDAAFAATDLNATFAALGQMPIESAGIIFTTPDIAENGAVVPIKIEVDEAVLPGVSRLYVMVEKNPNPMAAMFSVVEDSKPYIETRVKVAQTCKLYAVAENEEGFFMASKETKVTLGGCGG